MESNLSTSLNKIWIQHIDDTIQIIFELSRNKKHFKEAILFPHLVARNQTPLHPSQILSSSGVNGPSDERK